MGEYKWKLNMLGNCVYSWLPPNLIKMISNLGIIAYMHKNTNRSQQEFWQINRLHQESVAAEFFIWMKLDITIGWYDTNKIMKYFVLKLDSFENRIPNFVLCWLFLHESWKY
jgi:hypothetical protein